MFENRLQEAPLDQAKSFSSGFFFIPCQQADSVQTSAFGGVNWLYQKAFEDARNEALASKQRENFAASLN